MFSPGFWDASSSLFLGVALTHISTYTFNSADVLQKEEQLCPVVLVGLQLVEAGQIPIVACMLGRIPYGFLHLLGTYRRYVLGSWCTVSLLLGVEFFFQ